MEAEIVSCGVLDVEKVYSRSIGIRWDKLLQRGQSKMVVDGEEVLFNSLLTVSFGQVSVIGGGIRYGNLNALSGVYAEGSTRPRNDVDPTESIIWVPHEDGVVEVFGDIEAGRIWCPSRVIGNRLIVHGLRSYEGAQDEKGRLRLNSYCRSIMTHSIVKKGKGFLYYKDPLGEDVSVNLSEADEGVMEVTKTPKDHYFITTNFRNLFRPPEILPPDHFD